jgi:hypothetical protein
VRDGLVGGDNRELGEAVEPPGLLDGQEVSGFERVAVAAGMTSGVIAPIPVITARRFSGMAPPLWD